MGSPGPRVDAFRILGPGAFSLACQAAACGFPNVTFESRDGSDSGNEPTGIDGAAFAKDPSGFGDSGARTGSSGSPGSGTATGTGPGGNTPTAVPLDAKPQGVDSGSSYDVIFPSGSSGVFHDGGSGGGSSSSGSPSSSGASGTGSGAPSSASSSSGSSGGSSGSSSGGSSGSSSGGSSGSSSGGSSSGAGSSSSSSSGGTTSCVCSGGQMLYPTVGDCAIATLANLGLVCSNQSGFAMDPGCGNSGGFVMCVPTLGVGNVILACTAQSQGTQVQRCH